MSFIRKAILAGGSAALLLGLAGCAGSPSWNGNQSFGQESTFHTPQGESGSPHGHGSTAIGTGNPGYSGMGAAGSVRGTGTGSGVSGNGQESSQHTPQGETGTPHSH